jgi:prephenate dehydrogenase
MPIKITIIGLGQVGGSIGLALAQYKNNISVLGHDKDAAVERAAQKKGVVEKIEHNLPRAVQDAQMIILAVPVHQVRETLEFIAPDLIDGAIIVDMSPVKSEVAKWVKEILPAKRYYVGLVPTIGSDFLQNTETGLDSARADLFSKSIFLLDAPTGVTGEAVQLVMDLVQLLGATAMLADIVESDGLMASVHILPQLVSAALLNATVGQPGWLEGRKLAGRAYAAATSGLMVQDDPDALRMLSLHNRENVIRSLDSMIAALYALRNDIEAEDDDAVKTRLLAAHEGREIWLNERLLANWDGMQAKSEKPASLSERLFSGLLGGRPKK